MKLRYKVAGAFAEYVVVREDRGLALKPGQKVLINLVFDGGFTSIIDRAFGPDGPLWSTNYALIPPAADVVAFP